MSISPDLDRLGLCLEQGALDPTRATLLLRPPADYRLTQFFTTVSAWHPLRDSHDALTQLGIATSDYMPDMPADQIILFITRDRAANRALTATALSLLSSGGTLLITGQKTDGIDSLQKECRKLAPLTDIIVKSHGRAFWMKAPAADAQDTLVQWQEAGALKRNASGYWAAAGIFSADHVDPGSALLLEHLPPLKGAVADLGAGWGYLSQSVLRSNPECTSCTLFELDRTALTAAERNVLDMRAQFCWRDVTALQKADGPFDTVIMNPPFHRGRQADPSLGKAFIAAAARILKPGGHAFIVANRQLGYEDTLNALFRRVERITQTNHYKIFQASFPKKSDRPFR